MTDHDRGAYTPQNDAPLAFDARRSRGGSSGPAPLTLIVSAVVLLLLIIALLLFYRSGVRGAGQPPQVVGAPVGQTKSAPAPDSAAPSGGASSLQIYKSEVTPSFEPKNPTFTPAPEAPAPRPAPVAPVQSAPTAPAAPAPAPAAPVSSAPLRPAQTEPSVPAPPPSVAVAPSPVHTITPAAKPVKPVKPATVAKPVVAAGAPAAGENLVQIGAFSSSALANKGWSDTAALVPGRMAGKTEKVEAASRDGKNFYRSFVGGFSSHADAVSFCVALKAAGKTCMVR